MSFTLLIVCWCVAHVIRQCDAKRLQAPPTRACTAGDENEGRWLCTQVDSSDVRSKRCIYAPYNCRYRHYTRASLLKVAARQYRREQRPLWLMIAGDSRTRGMWLYLVDLLLEARNLTTAEVYKCWGQNELRTRTLRLTWRDMRSIKKDKLRWQGSETLEAVKADFAEAMRDEQGRQPHQLAMQFGLDVVPANFSGQRTQLSSWDYWQDGERLIEKIEAAGEPWRYFDTHRLTEHMMDQMCDEGADRKHFHTTCGTKLCGFVNQMQTQMLLTHMLGPPPAVSGSAARAGPVQEYTLCWKCEKNFKARYRLNLPPYQCTENRVDSIMQPPHPDRQFCVQHAVILDGSYVKMAGRDVDNNVFAFSERYMLPGAVGFAEENAAAETLRPPAATDEREDVILRLRGMLEEAQAAQEMLQSEFNAREKQFHAETKQWASILKKYEQAVKENKCP